MRKKLDEQTKRNNYIGIKVKQETRNQLNYIANREAAPLSTLINTILKEYIENYFKIAKINWDTLTEDEKRGEEQR